MKEGKNVRSYGSSYDYFFVKPGRKDNVHKTAQKLIGIKRVREVVITEGDYGFIVKADPLHDDRNDLLGKEIIKVVGGSSKMAVCYCEYSKK